MNPIERLASVGSRVLPSGSGEEPQRVDPAPTEPQQSALSQVLIDGCGRYVFDAALLIRPRSSSGSPLGIQQWNEPELWKRMLPDNDAANSVFFAEDVFGWQFALDEEGGVLRLDPERGVAEDYAESPDEWASRILADPAVEVGAGLASKWVNLHGPIQPGFRLAPRRPFVVGGEFAVPNLVATPDIESIRFRLDLARQIRDLPDGTQIEFRREP